jgi:beta-lactamase regulating signal transducer with metallopeptidase domain
LLGLWLTGTSALLARLAHSAWALKRMECRARRITSGKLLDDVRQVASELGLSCPRLYCGSADAMPMVWGIGRGNLLLPACDWQSDPTDANALPAERLRAVLLHELSHLRRRDPLGIIIGEVARAAHWFNPLAWLALAQLRIEQERACDDDALRGGIVASAYAGHLLAFANRFQPAASMAAMALAMARRSRLEGRVQSILDPRRSRRLSPLSAAIIALSAILITSAVAALRANEPESKPAPEAKKSGADSKSSAETPTAAPAGPVVMGIDLSQEPWVLHPKGAPDLYEPSEPLGNYQLRKGVFEMQLNDTSWLGYLVPAGKYFFEFRTDRVKPETERTYGPYVGDPFEKLPLEDFLAKQMQNSRSTADAMYRVRLMLRLHDAKMTERAVRLVDAALSAKKDLPSREIELSQIRDLLKEFGDELNRHASATAIATINGKLDFFDAELERMSITVPDKEYQPADPVVAKQLAAIPNSAFGKSVDGLRAAAVPEHESLAIGSGTKVKLVIENTTDHAIRFSCGDLLQECHATVTRTDGSNVEIRLSRYSQLEARIPSIAPISRYVIQPHERWLASEPSLVFNEKASTWGAGSGVSEAIAGAGKYRLTYTIYLGMESSHLGMGSTWSRGSDGEMHRTSPAKGEWKGSLTTGEVNLAVEK